MKEIPGFKTSLSSSSVCICLPDCQRAVPHIQPQTVSWAFFPVKLHVLEKLHFNTRLSTITCKTAPRCPANMTGWSRRYHTAWQGSCTHITMYSTATAPPLTTRNMCLQGGAASAKERNTLTTKKDTQTLQFNTNEKYERIHRNVEEKKVKRIAEDKM